MPIRIMDSSSPTLSPLLVRPGARYRCFGDGLCCTDIHAIGPLSEDESGRLRVLNPDVVFHNPLVESDVLATQEDGSCVFLGEQGCALHEAMDGLLKPSGCWQYPIGLTATPNGGRVSLEHRCPCTTLGTRPLLTSDDVTRSLSQGRARSLVPNHVVDEVPLTNERSVPFSEYEMLEKGLLLAIAQGEPIAALDASPFPKMTTHDWSDIADDMDSAPIGGRFQDALRWFARGIRCRGEALDMSGLDRPWQAAFERAAARPTDASPADAAQTIFCTFAADQLWSLFWTENSDLVSTRKELVTRLTVGHAIADALRAEGIRADQAAAEAVMVLDVVGMSDWWLECIREF